MNNTDQINQLLTKIIHSPTLHNAPLASLDQMTEVEDDEAANMKAFLKQLNLEPKQQS